MGLKANVVDGKIYVMGGAYPPINLFRGPPSLPLDKNEVYDPDSDSWTDMEPMPTAVNYYASTVVDGKIYVIGGMGDEQYPMTTLDIVQIFDPKSNTWTQGKSMPVGVASAAAAATSGLFAPKKIYVMGGFSANNSTETVSCNLTQIYDPQTDSWSLGTDMPTAHSYLTLTNVDDVLYAIGGNDDSSTISIANEKYMPIGYSSSPLPNSPSPSLTPSNSPTQPPTPSPSIPEFPPLLILPIMLIFACFVIIIRQMFSSKGRSWVFSNVYL